MRTSKRNHFKEAKTSVLLCYLFQIIFTNNKNKNDNFNFPIAFSFLFSALIRSNAAPLAIVVRTFAENATAATSTVTGETSK